MAEARKKAKELQEEISRLENIVDSREELERRLREIEVDDESVQDELRRISRQLEAATGEIHSNEATLGLRLARSVYRARTPPRKSAATCRDRPPAD